MIPFPPVVDQVSGFRNALDRLVEQTRTQALQKERTANNREFRQQAQTIRDHASKLLKLTQAFQEAGGHRIVIDNEKTAAADRFMDSAAVNDSDAGLFRAGTDLHAIQYPLCGLIAYMEELRDSHAGKDSRASYLARTTVKQVIRYCTMAGIPHGPKGYEDTGRIIKAVFAKINADRKREALLLKQPRDRDISALRTAYQKLGDSPEWWQSTT